MTTGVLLLNFGEPAEPNREAVLDYLERIFLANARLEEADTEAFERLFEAVLRRHHGRLLHRETAVDREALRSAVGRRVRERPDGSST